ncbi:hypothetical protein [Pelotalea chapellei]|uniref:Glycoside hydrolase family 42 N-terminal domain-containing protein n=1 Tax=Pelotalea chapellei TaxID=44671 RepID=A0ABS5U5L4_9BACT|nr:hypothetical protein [Pelotalea chapellei]MBT1070963.1 hypothetical protein [Pelotalea chapellei]
MHHTHSKITSIIKIMFIRKLYLLCGLFVVLNATNAQALSSKNEKFIITFWSPPPFTSESLSKAVIEGFNLTSPDEYRLDMVSKSGMMSMLKNSLLTPSTIDTSEGRAKLDLLINRVKDHPSLKAYYITDEPKASDFPGLAKLVAYLRERDPKHFAFINLPPIYASNTQLGVNGTPVHAYQEYLQRFIEEVNPSLISYDHYHFFKTGDGDQFFLNLELIRKFSLKHGLPFWNTIQASTVESNWRTVNANELRWLVYTTLAYGARGISYFLYWGPVTYGGGGLYQGGIKTPLVDSAAVINKELAAVGSILIKLDSMGVYHTSPLPPGTNPVPVSSPVQFIRPENIILALFGRNNVITTFMVVNRNYKIPVLTQLTIGQGVIDIEEFDRRTMKWRIYQNRKGQVISVTIAPGDGRVFRFIK